MALIEMTIVLVLRNIKNVDKFFFYLAGSMYPTYFLNRVLLKMDILNAKMMEIY